LLFFGIEACLLVVAVHHSFLQLMIASRVKREDCWWIDYFMVKCQSPPLKG
jgi:hypothetical protein